MITFRSKSSTLVKMITIGFVIVLFLIIRSNLIHIEKECIFTFADNDCCDYPNYTEFLRELSEMYHAEC